MSSEERAKRAEALLKQPYVAGFGDRGADDDRRERILQVAELLNPEDVLAPSDLDDLRSTWEWLCRQNAVWEYWMPTHPPSDDMQTMVLDGRPDLGGDPPENLCLAGEPIDSWVSVGHAHDGHVFLFWDTTAGSRIVTVDNSDPEVLVGEHDGVESYLLDQALPDMIRRLRPPKTDAPTSRQEVVAWTGCIATVLAVGALGWWLWS